MPDWPRTIGTAAALLTLGVALLALLWPATRHKFIYPGGRLAPDRADPKLHGLPRSEQVWLEAEDGVRVHAWWTPAQGAPRGAVVYCHGNAESMATRAWIADSLAARGFDVLLFDYRGYGLSEGRAEEEGLARDARAAWRHVVEDRGAAPGRVILMGHSLGSAVAARLTLSLDDDDAPAGLIVGSPFPDMPALFRHHAPWLPDAALRWRTDHHAAGSRLAELDVPLLVLIGDADATIPPAFSRRVFEAAGEPKRLAAAPAGHGELMGHPDVWAAIDRFLAEVLR